MALELLLSGALGAGLGAGLSYWVASKKAGSRIQVQLASSLGAPKRQIDPKELESMRRRYNTLNLEKELWAGALTQLYEAEAQGKISKEERAALVKKYREEIRKIEEQLSSIELYIEVGELEKLREELLGLLEEKIGNIEARLEKARQRLEQLSPLSPTLEAPNQQEEQRQVVNVTQSASNRAERKRGGTIANASSPSSGMDSRVKELREEVLRALARLEQMDIEG